MGNISLLDCTLRDGGYVNDWRFGQKAIEGILASVGASGVEIVEMGFMRDDPVSADRSVYVSNEHLAETIGKKQPGVLYSAMFDAGDIALPVSKISDNDGRGVDMFRLITWRRTLEKSCDNCLALQEKGYKACIQPTRVDQYSEKEFADLCERVNKVRPHAFYMVDTFGLLHKRQLQEYARLAHETLDPAIQLGYHAHNNMQQALINAVTFLEMGLSRDLIVDASILGIGRGAGNLFLEVIAEYLNREQGKHYDLNAILAVAEQHVEPIRQAYTWGYSLPYFLSGLEHCNPGFASYYEKNTDLSLEQMRRLMAALPNSFLYTEALAKRYYEDFIAGRPIEARADTDEEN